MKRIAHAFPIVLLLAIGIFAQDREIELLSGSIAVNTLSNYAIPFTVLEGGGTVSGRFTAQGTINAYILDADGLTNLRAGAQAPTYYNSGNVAVANINIKLASGLYYLVFDNKNVLSNKTVLGNITLTADRRSSGRRCTVRRGGATLYPESDNRRIRLKAGTRLGYIEAHGNAFVLVTYGRINGTVAARQLICK